MYGLWLLEGIIIGLQIGLSVERIRWAISSITQKVEQSKSAQASRSLDKRAVDAPGRLYEKGKTIDLPEYQSSHESGIIRSRKPKEVRRQKDKEFERVYQEVAAKGKNG